MSSGISGALRHLGVSGMDIDFERPTAPEHWLAEMQRFKETVLARV